MNLDEAIELLQKAVKLESENVYIWDSLAWAYYQNSDYKKALKSMEIVLEIDVDDTVVRYHLGNIFWKLGKKDRAVKNWKAAVEIANNKKAVQEAKFMLEKIETNK